MPGKRYQSWRAVPIFGAIEHGWLIIVRFGVWRRLSRASTPRASPLGFSSRHHFGHVRNPEEIRKANLCGADLRGAKIDERCAYGSRR